MIVEEVINYFDCWAPPGVAWEKDNVGLQVGSSKNEISKIIVCLELNQNVLDQAIKNNCDLIITHHPFIFKSLSKIQTNQTQGKIIEQLIKNNITLFSAHTNLDFTKDGVSFALADKLCLKNQKYLMNFDSNQYKLTVFVPENNVEQLANALFEAGAGIIGDYKKCSFQIKGTGTFEGNINTNPVIGKKLNYEKVDEIKLEMVFEKWLKNKILATLYKNHPYEEPAFDLYKIENENMNYGAGVIGEIETPLIEKDFLEYVQNKLNLKNFTYCSGKNNKISKVALCGGSGSDMLNIALSKQADAFITADVKYHTFQDAEEKILLVDAGHYETEIHIVDIVVKKMNEFIKSKKEKIKVMKFTGTTNPMKFYNNKGDR